MSDFVKIVECPRDAWQGLPGVIPTERKADYLRKLVAAGFTHIDAVSFVSSAAIPQMADSEAVLELLGPQSNVELIGIVVNERGAERAVKIGGVQTLGFPYSISQEFLRRNQNQSREESLSVLKSTATLARHAGVQIVAYVSMAFGNPYGDAWNLDEVIRACGQLLDLGIRQISLADTVGLSIPAQITDTLARTLETFVGIEIGVHLHARRTDAPAKIRAAYHAGCRRFDSALGGLGGCPFAQDELVGNIPTEILINQMKELGAKMHQVQPLDELLVTSNEIASEFGTAKEGSSVKS